MDRAKEMTCLLTDLIKNSEEGAAEIQMTLRSNGSGLAGAVKASTDYAGWFEMMTVGQRQSPNGRPEAMMIKVIFHPEDIETVHLPVKQPVVIPAKNNNGIVLPGRH